MLIYAHRGSSAVSPENSLAAFTQAITDRADGVELDLRATADGVPVVLHDRSLARTTVGRRNVDDLPVATLREVDAGDGHPVPTLVEVLDLLAGRLPLDLEIKQAGIERAILSVLRQYPAAEWVISSFDWAILRAVRAESETAQLWPLAIVADDALFSVARELGSAQVALDAAVITPDVMVRCAENSLGVMAWTVDEVAEARRLRNLGVQILCTNSPGSMRVALMGGVSD